MKFKLIIIIFTLVNLTNLKAQVRGKILSVSSIPQRETRWCWAASMEMIMNFHGDATTQENLAAKNTGITTCSTSTCGVISTNPCNQTIPEYSGTLTGNRFFTYLFNEYNYFAMEDILTEDTIAVWNNVKRQIGFCKPFIMVLGNYIGDDTNQVHAVVAIGYSEEKNATGKIINKKIYIHDPWTPCNGTTAYVKFPFVPRSSNVGLKVNSFIHHVYKIRGTLVSSSCAEKKFNSTEIARVDAEYEKLIQVLSRLKDKEQQQKLLNGKLGATKIKQISQQKLQGIGSDYKVELSNFFINNDIYDLNFGGNSKLIYRVENIDGTYKNTITKLEKNKQIRNAKPKSTIIEVDFIRNRFEYKSDNGKNVIIPLDTDFYTSDKIFKINEPVNEDIFLQELIYINKNHSIETKLN